MTTPKETPDQLPTRYYKATRTDATSFYDQTTKWRVGRIVRHPAPNLALGLCSSGVLHASDAPGESLAGGSWPCRLFGVEPRGELLRDGHNKVGCSAWKVVRELPAHEALGPNGEAVAALIERAGRLTADEVKQLSAAAWKAARDAATNAARNAAWYAARSAARYAAWNAAWNAAWYAARYAAWYAAWNAARNAAGPAAWYAAWYAAGPAARNAAWYAAEPAAGDTAGYAAGPAAVYAALALVVRDLITPKEFDLLYGPWREVCDD